MTDFSLYAGRWIALDENDEVVSVGENPTDCRATARLARPKDRLRLVWISPHPPYLSLPEWPLRQLRGLLREEEIWLAGGAVRDLLLERSLHDWDFAVAGQAMSLARRVANALGGAYVTLDAERDTGRVVIEDPNTHRPITLDFARLRGETIIEDLLWRDFTINAMALTLDGEIIDPQRGREDLRAGIIRATSDSTFTDDPARLLRAVRTAREIGFDIESRTRKEIRRHAGRIVDVSAERVRDELLRILATIPAATALEMLNDLRLLHPTLPEIAALQAVEQSWPHYYPTAWEHTLVALAAHEGLGATLRGQPLPRHVKRMVGAPIWAWGTLESSLMPFQSTLLSYLGESLSVGMTRSKLLKWGVLFHDVGKAQTRTVDNEGRAHFYGHTETGSDQTQARLTSLRFPKHAHRFVTTLVAEHMRIIGLSQNLPLSRRAVYRFYRDTGAAGIGVILISLIDALAVWGPKLTEKRWARLLSAVERLITDYFERREEVVDPPPLLSGHDLLAMGIPQGPTLGRLLNELREVQAAKAVTTREEALAWVRSRYEPTK